MVERLVNRLMGRGRKEKASKTRVMLELLLHGDGPAFGSELAERLPVGTERVRQRMEECEDLGYVDIEKVSGRNLYRLTKDGREYLSEQLRDEVD